MKTIPHKYSIIQIFYAHELFYQTTPKLNQRTFKKYIYILKKGRKKNTIWAGPSAGPPLDVRLGIANRRPSDSRHNVGPSQHG